MILIITHKDDYTADFVINKLNKKRIDYYRFNCEDSLEEDITLRFGNNSQHRFNGKKINFKSVWYRRLKLPNVSSTILEEKIYLLNEVEAFITNFFGVIKAKWLSEPTALRSAGNKFLQLLLAEEIGFKVPKTIVTNNKDSIVNFYNSNSGTIVKPINSGRINYANDTSKLIFTSLIPKEYIKKIDEFDVVPSIFQEYIEKEYELRVTVVDRKVFAAKVHSQSDQETLIDWRRKKLTFTAYDLPNELQNLCVTMLEKLGISFGAFDFIKTSDGEYYFLEVNPNGQWAWIEMDTGLKISDEIINFLQC